MQQSLWKGFNFCSTSARAFIDYCNTETLITAIGKAEELPPHPLLSDTAGPACALLSVERNQTEEAEMEALEWQNPG